MDAVERGARAIADCLGEDPDAIDDVPGLAHKRLSRWRRYAPQAAAVLESIRTPTKAMVNAALHWQDHCSDVDSLFDQMIGAALHGESLPPHPMLKLYTRTESVE